MPLVVLRLSVCSSFWLAHYLLIIYPLHLGRTSETIAYDVLLKQALDLHRETATYLLISDTTCWLAYAHCTI